MTNDDYLAIIKEHTTPAEFEALELHANGHSVRDAAEMLGISPTAYVRRVKRAKKRIQTRTPPRRRSV